MEYLENILQLKVSYFKLNFNRGMVVNSLEWNNGSSISYSLISNNDCAVINLIYKIAGRSYNYKIDFVSKPSNIGEGKIHYFKCPVSGKLARNLYLVSGMFVHRQAYKGQYYEDQIQSKRSRARTKYIYGEFGNLNKKLKKIDLDKIRMFYAGKQTKKFRAWIELMKRSGSLDSILNRSV